MNRRLLLVVMLCWVYLPLVTSMVVADQHQPETDVDEVFFENHIRPLLAQHCINCHGPETQSAGLRLDSAAEMQTGGDSGPVVRAGASGKDSLLIRAIHYDGDIRMPPDGKLSAGHIALLTRWVEAGAKWPKQSAMIQSTSGNPAIEHWAFQPLASPSVPNSVDQLPNPTEQPQRNPIDLFIASRLSESGLQPSPAVDARSLIRRVTYSLTGLPPTFADVSEFAENPSSSAYQHLVDRLLASPAYGEHWARHWLDIARYSDTKGYVYAREERFWVHAWTYRDWVVSALNADLPYNRFLLLQIAADQVPDRSEHDLAAMGFLTLGRRFLGVQRDIYDDRIDVVTRGTMSLTVGCARCHDHKYDPIPTADYYSLYGVFASSRERMVPLPTQTPVDAAFQMELNTRLNKLNDTLQERRAATSDRLRARIGDYLAAQFELNNYPEEGFDQVISSSDLLPSFVRRWQEFLRSAKQQQHPVFTAWHSYLLPDSDKAGLPPFVLPAYTNRLVAEAFATAPRSQADLIERYAKLFANVDAQWNTACREAAADSRQPPTRLSDAAAEEVRLVMYAPGSPCVVPDEPIVHTEYDFDSATCTELWKLQGEVDRSVLNAATPQPYAVVLEDRVVPVTPRIFKRGNPAQKGDDVPRQFLKLLSETDRQPFQHGSGRYELAQAIIDPQNPLTSRVIVNRVWAHHFGTGLVATPGDFGTRASPPSHPKLLDWLAGWFIDEGYSLKKLHRLIVTSQTYRQSSFGPADSAALQLAQQRDPENRLLWRMNTHRLSFEEMRDSSLAASGQLDTTIGGKPTPLFDEPFPVRRTLYGLIDRQFLPGTLRMFDFANPDLHIPQRSDTTVPQQALFLMNHPASLQQARHLATRVAGETTGSEDAVRLLYQRVLQRDPTAEQLIQAVQFLRSAEATMSDPAIPATAADWSYGFGSYDEQVQQIVGFTALPHFTGSAWQGSAAWPDRALGWVQLTATGGHPGNDRSHACIRRWTAPRTMILKIESEVVHDAAPGDGIRTFIVSSSQDLLNSASLHQKTLALDVESLTVEAGETIDFVCDIGDVLNSDQHFWRIQIHAQPSMNQCCQQPISDVVAWNSEADFTPNISQQLTPLAQLAQVLLCSNEFLFVD